MNQTMRGRVMRGGMPSGLSIALAVLPKCSLCAVAHASLLGWLGLSGAAAARGTRGVAAAAVVLAVGLLAWRARTRRGYAPAALGCLGALLVLADVFAQHPGLSAHAHQVSAPHSNWATWIGVAVLVAASLWNAWPRRNGSVCTPATHC